MMAQSQGSGQRGSDTHMDGLIFILVAILAVWLTVWMLWKYQQESIVSALFWTVGYLSKLIQYVPLLYPSELASRFPNWSVSLHLADPAGYGWDAASMMIQTISHTLTLFFVPFIILRLISLRRYHVINRFTRQFDLEKLKQRNTAKYAATASLQHENPLLIPIYKGPMAIARSPIDFALENHLIIVRKTRIASQALQLAGITTNASVDEKPIKGWSYKKMRMSVAERREWMPSPPSCRLDMSATDAIARKQLGGLFDVEKLDKFERCVLAILLIANVESLDKARELSLPAALSFRRLDKKGKHNPVIGNKSVDKKVNQVINDHINHPITKSILKKHAFKTTVFMGLLENAWKKGIFLTGEFLWLKPVNRTLFLTLNGLGGDRPFTEAMGPWAHYMVEQTRGAAITQPCIEGGSDGLKRALFAEMWIGSDDGTIQEQAEKSALLQGEDDTYSPTRGIDLFDPKT